MGACSARLHCTCSCSVQLRRAVASTIGEQNCPALKDRVRDREISLQKVSKMLPKAVSLMPQGVGSGVKPSVKCDESLMTFWRLAATAGYITKTAGDGGVPVDVFLGFLRPSSCLTMNNMRSVLEEEKHLKFNSRISM